MPVVDQPATAVVRHIDRLETGDHERGHDDESSNQADREQSDHDGDDNGTHVRRISHRQGEGER